MTPAVTLLLLALACLAYTAAAWRFVPGRLSAAQNAFATVALAAHTALLAITLLGSGEPAFGIGTAASLVAWQVALLFVVVGLREPVGPMARLVFPLAALGVMAGWFADSGLAGPGTTLAGHGPLVATHVLISILAYGLLTLAALQACLLAWQDRRLHHPASHAGAAARMPSLQSMEQLLFSMLIAGFVLLSISLATGLIVARDIYGQHLTHKTVLTGLAWLVFGALLLGRWRYGWRGRVAVRWTLGGYGTLALAYFGVKVVLEAMLGEHWGGT